MGSIIDSVDGGRGLKLSHMAVNNSFPMSNSNIQIPIRLIPKGDPIVAAIMGVSDLIIRRLELSVI